jgi:methionyl-tRNA formyltransferase
MGTPSFAVPSLEALAREHEVVLVVTRPDAVRSRGHELEPSPVKAKALELGLDVLECTKMGEGAIAQLSDASPDVICVAAFGCILPDPVLDLARYGCVNVHASLLPRWRGAAPIQRAILAGDERAGVSIMRIAHELDAGPYCGQASVAVDDLGSEALTAELASLGADELVDALGRIEDGSAIWVRQDEAEVTFAAKVTKREMLLDPADTALANLRRVRASSSTAPARTIVGGRGLRVMEATLSDADCEPGRALVVGGHVVLGCSDGPIEVLRVKPDGKREMDAKAWGAGLHADTLEWERV